MKSNNSKAKNNNFRFNINCWKKSLVKFSLDFLNTGPMKFN